MCISPKGVSAHHGLRQRHVQRAAVAQAGQRVGQRLFFGRGPGPLQPQVQGAQFLHDSRLRLDQVQKFHRQFGRREIGIGQGVIAHRILDPHAEGQVQQRYPRPLPAARPGRAGRSSADARRQMCSRCPARRSRSSHRQRHRRGAGTSNRSKKSRPSTGCPASNLPSVGPTARHGAIRRQGTDASASAAPTPGARS